MDNKKILEDIIVKEIQRKTSEISYDFDTTIEEQEQAFKEACEKYTQPAEAVVVTIDLNK